MHRVIRILTDSGRYYESHEMWDRDLQAWVGEEFFDLSESDAADEMRKGPRTLEVDVADVTGMDGEAISSRVGLSGYA